MAAGAFLALDKALHYPGGTGDTDSEGVTLTGAGPAGSVFVSTERDNDDSGVSPLRPLLLNKSLTIDRLLPRLAV